MIASISKSLVSIGGVSALVEIIAPSLRILLVPLMWLKYRPRSFVDECRFRCPGADSGHIRLRIVKGFYG